MVEDDEDVGNEEDESIPDTTIDGTNGIATADGEVESDEESEAINQPPSGTNGEDQLPSSASEPSSAEGEESGSAQGADEESLPPDTTSYHPNDNHHRSAWIIHGLIGLSVFGICVPIAMSSALFRDYVPHGWVYLHVGMNLLSFAMTFFAVGIAVATMNGTIAVDGGHHMNERHHVAGLLLLLLMSFQVANGFLRPPREFITNDENDSTPGAIFRPKANDRIIGPRMIWYWVHIMSGFILICIGSYQVQSGLGLYAKRFGTFDWSSAYIVYTCSLAGLILAGKSWMVLKERKERKIVQDLSSPEIQMGRGSKKVGYGGDDLTVAHWDTA
jgi:hypothetical protein